MLMSINLNSGIKMNTQPIPADTEDVRAAFGQQVLNYVYCEGVGQSEEDKEKYEARIYAKLRAGKELTPAELSYLAKNNPILYAKALRAHLMRKALENRLQACRSKQEAETVYQTAVNSISDKDPDKEMIIAALTDAYGEFRKSDEYKRLPEKAEEEGSSEAAQGAVRHVFNTDGYQETYKTDAAEISFSASR